VTAAQSPGWLIDTSGTRGICHAGLHEPPVASVPVEYGTPTAEGRAVDVLAALLVTATVRGATSLRNGCTASTRRITVLKGADCEWRTFGW
jgi:hypothetical protein